MFSAKSAAPAMTQREQHTSIHDRASKSDLPNGAGNPLLAELLQEVETLTLAQRELSRQREFHHQAYLAAEHAEREVVERMRLLLAVPAGRANTAIGQPARATSPSLIELPVALNSSRSLPGPFHTAFDPVTGPRLAVQLLGQFHVTVNDRSIPGWPSGRGRSIFKYLLTHREWPTPREMLMETFWPDTSPEAGRNNLNVALHGLRQALRTVTDVPVIIYQAGAYHLSPDLHVWLDVDAFDHHVQAGRRLEAIDQIGPAIAEYETAALLFNGDFLADDPYEEWAALKREQVRLDYLDTLRRLSAIYFDQGQYATCIRLCQLTLSYDNCNEEAHCALMRCYSRQGQYHLALRQYHICLELLHAELDLPPAPATTQLYESIRRREHI